MNIDPRGLAPILDTLASLADGAKNLPGMAGTIAGYIAAALKLGADLAAAGTDPTEAIQRIHAADTDLASVEDAWQRDLDAAFPSDAPTRKVQAQKP